MLHVDLGLAPDDGIIFAHIPAVAEVMMEHEVRLDEKKSATLYTMDDLAVDLLRDDEKPVKWYHLKNAARAGGFNFPEPFWTGPAADFSVKSLSENAKSPEEGYAMAVRSYHRGPWIRLTQEDLKRYE